MNKSSTILTAVCFFFISFALGYTLADWLGSRRSTIPDVLKENLSLVKYNSVYNHQQNNRTASTNSANNNTTANNQASQLHFQLADERGIKRSFEDVRDNSPALIYFFAPDSQHSINMLKKLNPVIDAAQMHGFKIIGVAALGNNLQPSQTAISKAQYQLPSPIFSDVNDQVSSQYGINQFSLIIAGADGKICWRQAINDSWPEEIFSEKFWQTLPMQNNSSR